MSAFVIKNLNRLPKKRDHTYIDLELDLKINYSRNSSLNNIKEQKDIRADYDINAIKNSISFFKSTYWHSDDIVFECLVKKAYGFLLNAQELLKA